ncbi:unnamed protein product [Meloidogyne enterolobii]|uniref:Uncharacterized protein n=1 Tax=Meloidogyne enterolobii TaxID=390850 RepID=A0ACB0Z442_MELEN
MGILSIFLFYYFVQFYFIGILSHTCSFSPFSFLPLCNLLRDWHFVPFHFAPFYFMGILSLFTSWAFCPTGCHLIFRNLPYLLAIL